MKTDLYIIHGWTYKPDPWLEVIESLKRHHINAKLLRVPGLGAKSDKVYTIEDYRNWAKENVPAGSIALGHSNGGRILLNLLHDEGSTYLSGLILLDSAGVYEPSKKRDLSRRLSKLFAPLKKLPLARKVVHKLLGASDYDKAPENMKKTLANMLDSDKNLDVSDITTKTEIIWGSDDQITPLRQGKKLHSALKNSNLRVKDGWRHSHYLVNIDELADEIASAYQVFQKGATHGKN